MSNIQKIPYEISIWEDVLVYNITYASGESADVTYLPDGEYTVNYQYFDERKLSVIGADTMEAPTRAHSPQFTRNINGSEQLIFSVYNHIYDYERGEYIDNPFVKLLTNERKIKLRYDEPGVADPWHDLVIKNVQESSDSKTYTYTATSIAINELSKNGFDIVLDNELMNNQGTIVELGEKVLEGSDWQLDSENCDVLKQWIEEPLYEVKLTEQISAKNLSTLNTEVFEKDKIIYVFYSYIVDNETENIQFITDVNEVNSEYVISRPQNIYMANFGPSDMSPQFYGAARAERLEYRQKSVYDDVSDRIVKVYKKDDKIYYGYTESKYISPTYVRDLIANGTNFTSTAGWGYYNAENQIGDANISVVYDPPIGSEGWTEATPCLNLNIPKDVAITNSGLYSNKGYLGSIADGQEFGLMVKAEDGLPVGLSFKIKTYNGKETYLTFSTTNEFSAEGYITYKGSWNGGLSQEAFLANIPTLFIESAEETVNFNIEDIQLFEIIKVDNDIIMPGELTGEKLIIQNFYYIYPANSATSKEEIQFVYKGVDTPPSDYIPVYNTDLTSNDSISFEKIRSIVGKESNRYNLIQSLCETFECWADFSIEHDKNTGKIVLEDVKGDDEKVLYKRQVKTVTFRENVGKENYAGFRYGVNLKNIQRTLESNQLASKVIVSPNSNELAQSGSCMIARAEENPTLENFILCFDYYIQHNLLDNNVVANDLYEGTIPHWVGYYPKLHKLNIERDALIEENSTLVAEESSIDAEYQSLQLLINENENLSMLYQAELANNSGFTYEQFIDPKASIDDAAKNNSENQNYVLQISQYKKIAKNAKSKLENIVTARTNLLERKETIEVKLAEIVEQKEKLNQQFYTKYSRYIQEGRWISEDYIDDNLYYLDAYNVARTSAFPKVSYTINVMSLEGDPEYVGYSFEVGDVSYIEDTEFFGYREVPNGVKMPYHEQVVVAERVDNLDSPESNQIRVQNYKTQFEDLFQRIEATSQAVEYSSGTLNKVSNTITSEGTIKVDILQNSLTNNSLVIQNAKDQSVVWGEQGITITNTSKPNEVVRLVSGGVMLSQDGGISYKTGITANGINASYITSGQLDTSVLVIRNGAFPAFRWDAKGINAYYNNGSGYNFNRFIRFDQYGLYGLLDAESAEPEFTENTSWEKRIEAIQDAAQFSVTWNGFRIKSSGNEGYVDISSADDIRVIGAGGIERVKIGRIGEGIYGMRLRDSSGASVLETTSEGHLLLSKTITVASSDNTIVRIGSLGKDQVINANDNFIVYEDGRIEADSATIKGKIDATKGSTFIGEIIAESGTIGGLDVQNIKNLGGIKIFSKSGNIFKITNSIIVPEQLEFSLVLSGLPSGGEITWAGGDVLGKLNKLPSNENQPDEITISKNLVNTDIYFLQATYTLTENEKTTEYTDVITISRIKDGEKGEMGPAGDMVGVYVVEPSQLEILKFIDEIHGEDSTITYSPGLLRIKLKFLGENFNFLKYENGKYTPLVKWNVDFENEEGIYQNLQNEAFQTIGSLIPPNTTDDLDTVFSRLMYVEDENHLSTLILDLASLKSLAFNTNLASKATTIATSNIGVFHLKLAPLDEEGKEIDVIDYPIVCKFGLTEDAARFNLKASGFEAAIDSTKLVFSENGLQVENGAFNIYRVTEKDGATVTEDLLYADADGNLAVVGNIYAQNGYFRGTVVAEAGSFRGTVDATHIEANSGNISGFRLENNSIIAENFSPITITKNTVTPNNDYYERIDGVYTLFNPFKEIYGNEIERFDTENVYFVFDYQQGEYEPVTNLEITPNANQKYLTLEDKSLTKEVFLLEALLKLEGGGSGKITTSNIEIGKDASIANYLQLGTGATIYNPDRHEGLVLKAGKTTIDNEGNLSITSIRDVNNRWNISAAGKASFDELYVNYAEIGTSVLKVNTIQAAGSTMIFKEAYNVVSIKGSNTSNQIQIILDENFDSAVLGLDDYVMLSCRTHSHRFKIVSITDETPYVYTLETAEDFAIGSYSASETSLLRLGSLKSTNPKGKSNYVFAISSDYVDASNNSAHNFFHSNSLTFSELVLDKQTQDPVFKKHIVLGKLENLDVDISGYGLYADNVYLNGTLVTKSNSGSSSTISAGMSTTHDVRDAQYGRIVIWAGAKDGKIESAPFRVTETGMVYASQGQFSDSLFVDSSFRAAKIYTSEVHASEDTIPSLKIYNTSSSEGSGGIWFVEERSDNPEKPTLSINSSGMYAYPTEETTGIKIVELSDSSVNIFSNRLEANTLQLTNGLHISNYQISRFVSGNSGISLDVDTTRIYHGASSIYTSTNEIQLKTSKVNINKDLSFNNDAMRFEQVNQNVNGKESCIGYNIFIL